MLSKYFEEGSFPGMVNKVNADQALHKDRDKTVQGKMSWLYTNVDGLNKFKGSELSLILKQLKQHLVFITETKTDGYQTISQFIECASYNVFR